MATFWDSSKSRLIVYNSSSTAEDVSPYVKSVDGLPGIRRLNNVTAFGAVGDQFSAGLQGQEVTIEMVYSEDASVSPAAVFVGLRTASTTHTFQFYPTGSTAACHSGSWWCEDFTIKPIIGSAIMATAKCKVDNGVTSS